MHEKVEDLQREIAAPAAPLTEAVMEVIDGLGTTTMTRGEVITEPRRELLIFSVTRG